MWLIQMYFYLNELLINCESLFTGAWCWEAGEEDKLWADWRGHFPGRIISAHTVSHFGIRTKWTKLRSVWVSGWHSEDVITQQPPVIHFIQVTVYNTGVHELLIDIDFSELHTHFEILVVGGFEVFLFYLNKYTTNLLSKFQVNIWMFTQLNVHLMCNAGKQSPYSWSLA